MADYRELLRRAINALPENNGAARRQVYEKARSALVDQLRAIDPPLQAREITQHRLELEDCIRQVEQAATDELLGNLHKLDEAALAQPVVAAPAQPDPEPVPHQDPEIAPAPAAPAYAPEPEPAPQPESEPVAPEPVAADHAPETAEAEIEPEAGDEVEAEQETLVEEISGYDEVLAHDEGVTPGVAQTDPEFAGDDEIEPVAAEPAAFETAEDVPVHDIASEPEVVDEFAAIAEDDDGLNDVERAEAELAALIAAAEGDAPAVEVETPKDIAEDIAPVEAADDVQAHDAALEAEAAPEADEAEVEDMAPTPDETIVADMDVPEPASDQSSAVSDDVDQADELIAEPTPAAMATPDVSIDDDMSAETSAEDDLSAMAGLSVADDFDTSSAEPAPQIVAMDSDAPVNLRRSPAAGPGSIADLIAQAQGSHRHENVEVPEAEPADPVVAETQPQTSVTAMSRVLEVENEDYNTDEDAQHAIDSAIAALDREARGEGDDAAADGEDGTAAADAAVASASAEAKAGRRGGGALTIFLLVFALLLAGVVGGGYWAWQEGYVDVNSLFGQAESTEQTATETGSEAAGPGNTAATPQSVETVAEPLGKSEERLPASEDNADAQTADTGTAAGDNADTTETADNAAGTPNDATDKSEDRLPTEGSFSADNPDDATTADGDEAVAAIGAQSLLLEASNSGATGAVPYSGTVEWSRGTDELGLPTIIAQANIPARNLSVSLLIRRNADSALPASHIMEVDFSVTESFFGGAIAGLPGILMKNEELVRGTPLVGASARVVGNSFLYALSAADQDIATNLNLLRTRKWMDLAMVYATNTRAIVTLEKDDAAVQMFNEVLDAWAAADGDAAPAAETAPAEGDDAAVAPAN